MNKAGADMNLFLVFTGSSRDKLSRMVIRHGEPFYGSSVHPFPLLGQEFVADYTGWINQSLSEPEQIDLASMAQAFDMVGYRPDELKEAVAYAAIEADKALPMGARLMDGAQRQQDLHWSEFDRIYDGLPELSRVVFRKLMADGEHFSPFSEASRQHYADQLGLEQVSNARVQRALTTLGKYDLIWTPQRGAYVLEDSSVADWYANRQGASGVEDSAQTTESGQRHDNNGPALG